MFETGILLIMTFIRDDRDAAIRVAGDRDPGPPVGAPGPREAAVSVKVVSTG
jgi:hypothetical protein